MASNSKINSEISNVLFNGVRSLVRRRATPWVGTMTDLENQLSNHLMNTKAGIPAEWPRSPSAMRIALNVVVNRLRNDGISIRFSRSYERLVEFRSNR